MKPRGHDPLRLDVAAFAAAGAELSGQWPAQDLPRLAASQTAPSDVVLAPIDWRLRGESRAVAGGAPQVWLHLAAGTEAWLACQRCLQPYRLSLKPAVSLQFVRGEDQAAALDADSEHDVLALEQALNARALVEDELLLALPLVPMHEACPQPLAPDAAAESPAPAEAEPAKPFAGLAALKRRA